MHGDAAPGLRIAVVSDAEWETVAWLWQAFREDMAPVVSGLPYANGRYQTSEIANLPSADGAGYLAWRRHPRTGEDAPVGFAVVDGLTAEVRSVTGFWVAPAARRDGVGWALAIAVLSRHEPPWSIGFQHENIGAGTFWRAVADVVFGEDGWSETRRPVPARAVAPADHFIESPGKPV